MNTLRSNLTHTPSPLPDFSRFLFLFFLFLMDFDRPNFDKLGCRSRRLFLFLVVVCMSTTLKLSSSFINILQIAIHDPLSAMIGLPLRRGLRPIRKRFEIRTSFDLAPARSAVNFELRLPYGTVLYAVLRIHTMFTVQKNPDVATRHGFKVDLNCFPSIFSTFWTRLQMLYASEE